MSAKEKQKKIQKIMLERGIDGMLLSSNTSIYYLLGRIIYGYIYLPSCGDQMIFVVKPKNTTGENTFMINKPEQIPSIINEQGLPLPKKIAFENDYITQDWWERLKKAFSACDTVSGSGVVRKSRMVKTSEEIEIIKASCNTHVALMESIPALYTTGMTDLAFSIEIERKARLLGHLGTFRAFGSNMEIHMGSVLSGENGEAASPFEYALGGAGIHPSAPVGVSGEVIKKGSSVMVDIGGNFTGYITDLTRTYSAGKLTEEAYKMHKVSLEIQEAASRHIEIGMPVCELYERGLKIVKSYHLEGCFMGTVQQAKFFGHGLGIEINEMPVVSAKDKTPIEENMVIALEPKFICSGVGPVGTENTYLVKEKGLENLTAMEDEIVDIL